MPWQALGQLARYWRAIAAVLAVVALWWLVSAYQGARADLTAAQGQIDQLRDRLAREQAATAAAQQAAADWTAEAADRARDLADAIEQGKQADEDFAACMSMRWSDAVIDRLPD
jgi:type VI protein secretion system component VasK